MKIISLIHLKNRNYYFKKIVKCFDSWIEWYFFCRYFKENWYWLDIVLWFLNAQFAHDADHEHKMRRLVPQRKCGETQSMAYVNANNSRSIDYFFCISVGHTLFCDCNKCKRQFAGSLISEVIQLTEFVLREKYLSIWFSFSPIIGLCHFKFNY